MKKFNAIFSAIASVMAFASCSEMSVESGANLRNAEIRLQASSLEHKSGSMTMKVSAYAGESLYFTDIFEVSGGMWEGSQKRYWPAESGRMSFYGYPCNVSLVEGAEGVGFGWSVAREASEQEDLLVAKAEASFGESSVVLVPESVLSAVEVKVEGADANVQYEIRSVRMVNVLSEGFYSFTAGGMKAEAGSAEEFNIPAEGAIFHMIPQSLNGIAIVAEYSVYHHGCLIYNGEYSASLSGSWKGGRSYSYTLSLPNGAQGITWSPSVGGWE